MKQSFLSLTLRSGEMITIGKSIVFVKHYNDRFRIYINAPKDVIIERLGIFDEETIKKNEYKSNRKTDRESDS